MIPDDPYSIVNWSGRASPNLGVRRSADFLPSVFTDKAQKIMDFIDEPSARKYADRIAADPRRVRGMPLLEMPAHARAFMADADGEQVAFEAVAARLNTVHEVAKHGSPR